MINRRSFLARLSMGLAAVSLACKLVRLQAESPAYESWDDANLGKDEAQAPCRVTKCRSYGLALVPATAWDIEHFNMPEGGFLDAIENGLDWNVTEEQFFNPTDDARS